MRTRGTVLKLFLGQRHWQSYQSFRQEWGKAAVTVDEGQALAVPGERTVRRWKSGGVHALPANRCRVLECMFPGYSADQLLAPIPVRRPLRRRHWESRGQLSLFETAVSA